MDFLDQPGIFVGDADHLGAMAGRGRTPRDFLQQPGPERVEFAHVGHINCYGFRPVKRLSDGIGESFQRRHIGRSPGTTRTQFKQIAFRRSR